MSAEKTKITHISEGFDFLGQTLRKYERPGGKPAKLQITPSKTSLQAVQAKVKALCKSAPSTRLRTGAGKTPEWLIDKLNPVPSTGLRTGLRGWANYHRHVICADTFFKLDHYVWQRVYRWARYRHPNKSGHWVAERYFSHEPGWAWRFTAPKTGKCLIQVQETVKYQLHVKIQAHANPFDPEWEAYREVRFLPDRRASARITNIKSVVEEAMK